MHSSLFAAISILLIQSISGEYTADNRVIIGSSVGGILGLVSFIFEDKKKKRFLFFK
jgi:hypothetical protein